MTCDEHILFVGGDRDFVFLDGNSINLTVYFD